jgi:hypothetical protein
MTGETTMKHWILAAALLGLAACGGKSDEAATDGRASGMATAPAAEATKPPAAPVPEAAPAAAVDAPLQVADIDAYVRGMHKEAELLHAEYHKIEQARAANDSDAETEALFAMTANGIDEGGAKAAGLSPARYGFVKNRIDEVQSKLDMLEGFRKMEGDSSALQAQVGDPYAGFAADVAMALKARQAETAALRADAIGLRVKAAGG